MAFTEFYIQASGADTNAGSTADNSAVYTATNGAWNKDSGVNEGTFTPASGDPSATVAADMFGAIYVDGGAVAAAVMRVKSVTSTTIVFDQAKFAGVIPTDAANGMTVKVGGAWATPSFGIPFMTSTLQNNAGDTPRCNIKEATYATTAVITQSNAGPIRFEKYSTAAGTSTAARAHIAGNGGNFHVITSSGTNLTWIGIEASNVGNSAGNVFGFNCYGVENAFIRCVAHDVRQGGFVSGNNTTLVECEAYACNQANSAGYAGFYSGTATVYRRCISHDNSGSNARGYTLWADSTCIDCIADTNGADGFNCSGTTVRLLNCDSYNNTGDGIDLSTATGTSSFYIENCNLVKNGGYGINGSGAGTWNGQIVNCGFGAGTQANTSGTVAGLKGIDEVGSVTHTSNETPWTDAADGDFRITLSTAKNAGRGSFTQTQSGYGDPNATVAYNDIGAARHVDPAGGGGGGGVPVFGGSVVRRV